MIIGVIGANGFIGRSLCYKFLKEGYDVFALYNFSKTAIPLGCKVFSVDHLPDVHYDHLFVSIGGHGLTHQDYLNQYSFLEKILNKVSFSKVIFISSVEVYGRDIDIINVQSCYKQPSIYGHSKLSQEFIIRAFENFLIIRPTYVYGPGMNQNSIIPIWIKNAKEKGEIIVFGDGDRRQDYLYIEDLMDLCFLATKNSKKNVIIAATGNSISNYDLAKEIAKKIPNSVVKFKGSDDSCSLQFDISETVENYRWNPKISIEEGISKILKI